MGLQTPYGVVSGSVNHADLVNPSGGQWPHYHVWLNTPGGVYDSAINLKSLTQVKIEYRTRDLDPQLIANVLALPDGWTPLAQTPVSGALDYVRHPALISSQSWTLQTGDNLILQLQALLAGVNRVHVFGASYSTGLGVHDVHMNQGDPIGSQFAALDAIWQDGGLLFEYGPPQTRVSVLQIKFETQSLLTDDQGRPLTIWWRLPPRYVYVPWWKWPPPNPLTYEEGQELVEKGLFELLPLARTVPYLSGEPKKVIADELFRQIKRRIPSASRERLAEVAQYVVTLAVQFG
jgi:hypothetical protein